MDIAISIKNLTKSYSKGMYALNDISLDIKQGELFALLGPNGAGKTTLIGCITGYVKKTSGFISVFDHNIDHESQKAKQYIGVVPQELTLDIFSTVLETLIFQRGLYGKPKNLPLIQKTLTSLSLWDKRTEKVKNLSGGMKRRVLIAKALMNEPQILFLDEPTAGVDVELRHEMYQEIQKLKEQGTTIILTTHYLKEAEEMADRIGIIDNGKIIAVGETASFLKKLGKKRIDLHLQTPLLSIPKTLEHHKFELIHEGLTLRFFVTKENDSPLSLLNELKSLDIRVRDIDTKTSSLEEIFMQLIQKK
ncbi:MAG: ABC transporter ATP-binding protein [Candidatus Moraniibacteriota bacterium]|nr:MAG: ABC transporter ATP-binding protein [Candidatus Moranbacteria bacterium]